MTVKEMYKAWAESTPSLMGDLCWCRRIEEAKKRESYIDITKVNQDLIEEQFAEDEEWYGKLYHGE